MPSDRFNPFDIISSEQWNRSLNLLSRSLQELDPIQRTAALVFHYDGRIQNGGHSLYFDFPDSEDNQELIRALREVGALEQSRLLREACVLQKMESEADQDEVESIWATLAELDRNYHALRPDISELLVRYFTEHPSSFP